MAYDIHRDRIVLLSRSHTLEWNGSNWIDRTPAQIPTIDSNHALVYHTGLKKVIAFSDTSGLWAWDGNIWTNESASYTEPAARFSHGMTYDSNRQAVIMVGGTFPRASDSTGVWQWDGTQWLNISSSSTNNFSHSCFAERTVAYDQRLDEVVVLPSDSSSVCSDGTWIWNGSTWRNISQSNSPPLSRGGSSVAYDPIQSRVVWVGLEGTQEWNGSFWRLIASAEDTPSFSPIIFRNGLDLIYMYRPEGVATLAGSTWNISNITGDLTIRDSMMYDTNRDRVILLDGNGGRAGSTSSISEWDGSRWIDVTPTAPNPPARLLSAMAYDSAAQKGLLFGGTNANNTVNFSDTWELLPPDRSTVQFAMTLPDDLTEDMISNVRVRAFCGATYTDNTGVASFGAQLVGWVSGGL